MKEEIDIRKLTVQAQHRTEQWRHTIIVSRILLCGQWLKDAGFKPGDKVKIIVQDDLLIIQKYIPEKQDF